jgi:hypothetical protein
MSLLNWSNCKKLTLELASGRAHKFNRVSGSVKNYLEARLRAEIEYLVRHHPSIGKTITTGGSGCDKLGGNI